MASRIVALLLATPLLLLLLGEGHARVNQVQLPKVAVSHPLAREVTDHTDFRGRVEPGELAEVHARLGGEVTAIAFKPGDVVKKGDLLFAFDPRPAQAALQKAEAEYERSQAGVLRAQADLTRLQRAVEKGGATRDEVVIATAAVADAEAARKATRAGVELARLHLDSTKILAPIAAKVSRPSVKVGSVVTAATPLVTLTASDVVHVPFEMDEWTALRLLRGGKGKKPVEFTVQVGLLDEADLPHRGRIDFSDLQFNPTTGTAQLRVTVPNPNGLFLPGLTAQVRLVEGKPYKAQLVSSRAFQNDAQGYYVLVVNAAGVVERRHVKIGRSQGALVPVTEGLKAEDLVIVNVAGMANFGRGGDATAVVGTTVDPEKMAMPERPLSSLGKGDWGRKGELDFGSAKGMKSKAKTKERP